MNTDKVSALTLTVRRPTTCADLARIAWARACEFGPLLRRDTRARRAAAAHWSWQWLLVGWQSVVLWGWLLPDTATRAQSIWMSDHASAVVHPARPHPRRWPAGFAVVTLLASMIVTVPVSLCLLAVVALQPSPVTVIAAVLWFLPVLMMLVRQFPAVRRTKRLHDGGYLISEVVARPAGRGHGTDLMRAIGQRLDEEQQIGRLTAASPDLVIYYRDVVGGWQLQDPRSRLMVRTPRGDAR